MSSFYFYAVMLSVLAYAGTALTSVDRPSGLAASERAEAGLPARDPAAGQARAIARLLVAYSVAVRDGVSKAGLSGAVSLDDVCATSATTGFPYDWWPVDGSGSRCHLPVPFGVQVESSDIYVYIKPGDLPRGVRTEDILRVLVAGRLGVGGSVSNVYLAVDSTSPKELQSVGAARGGAARPTPVTYRNYPSLALAEDGSIVLARQR
jgi:hypothetical protein